MDMNMVLVGDRGISLLFINILIGIGRFRLRLRNVNIRLQPQIQSDGWGRSEFFLRV